MIFLFANFMQKVINNMFCYFKILIYKFTMQENFNFILSYVPWVEWLKQWASWVGGAVGKIVKKFLFYLV